MTSGEIETQQGHREEAIELFAIDYPCSTILGLRANPQNADPSKNPNIVNPEPLNDKP